MRGDFRTEPPISGIIGVDSHGIPVYQVGGGIFAGTIDFHCVGDIRLRLGDGRGNLRAAKTPPLQSGRTRRYCDSGRGAAFSNRDGTNATPRPHLGYAPARRGTPRRYKRPAPIDTQGFACSGWGFSAAGAWRGCAADKNAIPRIGGGAGDPKPNFERPARAEPNAEASLWAAGWPRRASAM